jgi:phosphohistidine phosphatase
MRYLTIVRHAKATRAKPGVNDVDRELSGRGRRQCEQLRAWADDTHELGQFGPATALVSAAARTRETFHLAFEGTALVGASFSSARLYNGVRHVGVSDILSELAAVDPVVTSLVVVAHNPTVHELLLALVGDRPSLAREGYPVGAAYVVAIPEDATIHLARCSLVASYVPD